MRTDWPIKYEEDFMMNIHENIKVKRQELELTQKDFADALGLGRNGDRTLRRWENAESTPSTLEYKSVMDFVTKTPFKKDDESKFKFIDLFAGIGGICILFQELGGECVFTSGWDKFA